MAKYRVLVRCAECGETHLAKVLELEGGPARRTSLAELGESLGEQPGLASIIGTYMFCERTKKSVLQEDSALVFLEPAS